MSSAVDLSPSGASLPSSAANLSSSAASLPSSAVDLSPSGASLSSSAVDLSPSAVSLPPSAVDLSSSAAHLLRSVVDLSFPGAHLLRSCVDLSFSVVDLLSSSGETVKPVMNRQRKTGYLIPFHKIEYNGGAAPYLYSIFFSLGVFSHLTPFCFPFRTGTPEIHRFLHHHKNFILRPIGKEYQSYHHLQSRPGFLRTNDEPVTYTGGIREVLEQSLLALLV